jgi:hypothetical protein
VFEYAKGPVDVDVRAQGNGAAPNAGNVKLDFRDAVLILPKSFWVKPAGQSASVTFTMARNRDNTLMLNDIVASGANVSGAGVARLSAGGDLMEANTSRLVLKGSMDGRVGAKRDRDGVLDVSVTGPYLNIAPFFSPDTEDAVQANLQRAAAARQPLKPGKLSPAFVIEGKADRMELRAGAELRNGAVMAGSNGYAMTKMALSGTDPGGKPFSLTITPNANEPTTGRLAMKTHDAGFAVRAITGQTNIKGGTAEAEGSWTFAEKPSAQIQLRMKNFRLVQVPAMAQLLGSVASLTGMVDMLNGDGIQFGDLEAPMTMTDNRITLGECRAAGPSLGITAKGHLYLTKGTVDIDGVVVPSYGLNSMLGAVPILGDLLVSRKGEGVFGLTYSMNGPAEKPSVGVNPLSAFTPGIFRRIFEPLQRQPKEEKAG